MKRVRCSNLSCYWFGREHEADWFPKSKTLNCPTCCAPLVDDNRSTWQRLLNYLRILFLGSAL